jgi:hypothetical protein
MEDDSTAGNHPFSTHLRTMVKDALEILIDKQVPNAIPGYGFQMVIKITRDMRKKLGKRVTNHWHQVQFGPDEVWFAPAWHLLQLADAIDQPREEKAAQNA